MTRGEASKILKEIRAGKRYCRASDHFEEEAHAERFSIEDVWYLLRKPSLIGNPEDRGDGTWRVRLDGMTLDDRRARLVIDLSHERSICYVTIHAL